jgi:hypothetical protein
MVVFGCLCVKGHQDSNLTRCDPKTTAQSMLPKAPIRRLLNT